MLVTWVRDVYTDNERSEMRAAIDSIASPNTYDGFASNGVYVFFDPESKEVLYIGLARDLSERFAQHNGLVRMREDGCKVRQIAAWFERHERLGYAAALQSPFSQAGVGRQRGQPTREFYDEESGVFWGYDSEGLDHIADVEGQLIAAFTGRAGALPPWNKVQGRVTRSNMPTENSYALLELATGQADSLLLARRTIRQLASDPEALLKEEMMHVGRFGAVEDTFGVGVDSPRIVQALQDRANMPDYADSGLVRVWNQMCEEDYFFDPPPLPADPDVPGVMRRRQRKE